MINTNLLRQIVHFTNKRITRQRVTTLITSLYYFSTGRPSEEIGDQHSTLFKEVKGEKFKASSFSKLKSVVKDFIPPIVLKLLNR